MAKQTLSKSADSHAIEPVLAAKAADELSASAEHLISPSGSTDGPEDRCYKRLKMIDSLVTVIHASSGEFYNLRPEAQSFYHCAIAEFARGALVDLQLIQKTGCAE